MAFLVPYYKSSRDLKYMEAELGICKLYAILYKGLDCLQGVLELRPHG